MARKRESASKEMVSAAPTLAPGTKPLVFISHDSRDAELAELFGNLLTDASGGILKSFRSSDRKGTAGIEFGSQWYDTIMVRIRDATDVVALLTPNSVDRPWILYEAGVAKGKLDATVFGVALGIALEKASTGPFAQFQNSAADEDSLTKLVMQLIRRNPEASPREEAVRLQVQAFIKSIGALTKTTAKSSSTKMDDTAVAKLFEEVKIMFTELPSKLDSRLEHPRKRHGVSRTLRMAEEMLFRFRDNTPGSLAWLLFVTSFREEMPWLYEPGMRLYRALESDVPSKILLAQKELVQLLEEMMDTRLLELVAEATANDRDDFHLRMELANMVRHFVQRSFKPGKTAVPKVDAAASGAS